MCGRHMKIGIETEYLFKWISDDNESHLPPADLYEEFRETLKKNVKIAPSSFAAAKESFFIENGGAFSYEAYPSHYQDGLLESSTPEVLSGRDALCYQRAMEEIIRDTADLFEEQQSSSSKGFLRVLKNCRDINGNTYGCQENYDAYLNRHPILLNLGCFFMLLPMIFAQIFAWVIAFFIIIALIPFAAIYIGLTCYIAWLGLYTDIPSNHRKNRSDCRKLLRKRHPFLAKIYDPLDELLNSSRINAYAISLSFRIMYPVLYFNAMAVTRLYDSLGFKTYYKQLLPYIISRVIFTGSGTLNANFEFSLSERAENITSITRKGINYKHKPIFDSGHLYKQIQTACSNLVLFRFNELKRLFKTQQRLQICYSDSNRCDVSEFLKYGVTALLAEMAHKNELMDMPALVNPLQALKDIAQDSTLKVKVPMTDGIARSAVEIQYLYLNKLSKWNKSQPVISTANHEMIQLWQDVLDKLKNQQWNDLFGVLDWVTKKELLLMCRDLSYTEQKKIDLSYHDLREGPFWLLEKEGLIIQLIDIDEIIDAMTEPPETQSAKLRSAVIKDMLDQNTKAHISWAEARIKKTSAKPGQVIRLFD